MPYAYPELKNFSGLLLQQNSFTVPDGALEIAENVVINKDGVINKRRGFYTYYDVLVGTLNRLFTYQSKLLSVYTDGVKYYADTGSSPNETGTQTALTGETVAVSGGRVSRGMESNNNYYFTTNNGVMKLTAYNSNVFKTGAPQGLDVAARFVNGSSSNWLAGDKIVGYRVVFGYRDANDNLILSAPSSIVTITNTTVQDKAAARSGPGPYTITVTSAAHGLVTGQYLIFSGAATWGTSNAAVEGVYQITVTTADAFTYSVVADPGASGTVDYSYAMPVRLELTVPSEISTSVTWFYQVYRSSQQSSAVSSPSILSDFKLIDELVLTSAEITARVAFYTDDIDDILLGAELYTNENSREGELQANYRAPLCDDIALYKGFAIYANCTSRHILALAVIDPTVMAAGDYVEIKIDAVTRRYVARGGVANRTVRGTCSSSAGLLISSVGHGLANGDTVYISNITGASLAAGTYFVISVAADTFKISLTSGGAAIAYDAETSLEFQGVTNGTNPIFYLSTSSSAAVRLRDTAEALVKAINRDASSLIYAQYFSGINEVPGKMQFQAKGFGAALYVRANTTAAGAAFSPALPASFVSGTQVYSRNDNQPHVFFASKTNEPEAVPLVNFFTVGARNKEIIRVHPLRDSLIVLKEDGVYRVTGDNVSNFTVTLLDGTVQILAGSSSDVLNNQVVFLSNQGICLVSESSVQIISRKIENVIQPILGQSGLSAQTAGVAYESERCYLLTTTDPNSTTASTTYLYNFLTDSWTSSTQLFTQAVVGPGDVLYLISSDGDILKERKKQTRLDYAGQNYTVTVSSLDSDSLGCNITFTASVTPEIGDIIVQSNVITRIDETPVLVSGTEWTVRFTKITNLVNGNTPIFYKRYVSTIKSTPFHAGLVGRSKQFGQMQVHLRNNAISRLFITFVGNTYGSSEEVEWTSALQSNGWGFFPWGFEPWGQTDGIDLTQGTAPAPICRVYVPKFQARNTFIQPYLIHREAAEPIEIQAMSFAVRPYGERVSR